GWRLRCGDGVGNWDRDRDQDCDGVGAAVEHHLCPSPFPPRAKCCSVVPTASPGSDTRSARRELCFSQGSCQGATITHTTDAVLTPQHRGLYGHGHRESFPRVAAGCGSLRALLTAVPICRESDLFLLDAQQLRAGTEGWLVFDITAASSHWLVERKYNLGLRLYVETDNGLSVEPGSVGLLGRRGPRSKQPFMVTFFRASASPVRATRAAKAPRRRQPKKSNDLPHHNKLPGIFDDVHTADGRQVCRRHELYVSFQDLGWLDWVIAPQGYSAYYCEGECAFPLDSCMNATNHAILQSLVHLMKPEAVPKACCAPTKLSATSVLYYDSNNNVILKKHRNMVVKSCGCH
uniref:Bone morphotic protein 8a n=1 Tax=Gallus gallus TaxID=9031 RepID=A0A8V0Z390_CHICK